MGLGLGDRVVHGLLAAGIADWGVVMGDPAGELERDGWHDGGV
jgi:hypothetical protein